MNDQDLDRLVASAAPVRDVWLGGLDLGHAETELMEEIMATTIAPATTSPGPPAPEPPHRAPGVPRVPRSARRPRLTVAAGLVAAALVGAVVVRASTGDGEGDGSDVRAGTAPAVEPMIADPLPDGFGVNLVDPEEGPDPVPAPPEGPIDTWIYGDLTATSITNDVVLRLAPSAPEGDVLGETVTVRGQEGILCSPGPNQCDFGNEFTGVSWTEESGAYVTVESRTFDRDQVRAIAEGVVVDGDTVELGDVPAGVAKPPKLAEVGDDDRGLAYHVQYVRTSPDWQSFSVSTRAETHAMGVYDLWLSGPRDDVTVQGHGAAFEDIDGSYVLTWEPLPGQVVEVITNGVDEATARAFAETVRPASAAEWAEVQELARNAPPPDVADDLDDLIDTEDPPGDAVRRRLADGATDVVGWRRDDGGLCYQVADDGEPSSNLCAHDPATTVLGVSPTDNDGELVWDVPAAVGVAPDGTASIDGGEVTLGREVDGGRLFVWEFLDGEMPDSLTFRDAAGDELATTDVLVI